MLMIELFLHYPEIVQSSNAQSEKKKGGNMQMNTTEKMTGTVYMDSKVRNVYGTLAAEGMDLSESSAMNLDRISKGQATYQQVLMEIRSKYEKRG